MSFYDLSPHCKIFSPCASQILIFVHHITEAVQLMQHLQHMDRLVFEDLHDFQVIDELFTALGDPSDLSLIRCSLGDGRFGEDFGAGYRNTLLLKEINRIWSRFSACGTVTI